MLVYGDRSRFIEPSRQLDQVEGLVEESRAAASEVEAHDSLVAALIEAGMLIQGLADAEMYSHGCDTDSPTSRAAMRLVLSLARAVGRSWAGEIANLDDVKAALLELTGRALPSRIEVKQPEGYAYYGLYPEAYYEAARGLPAQTQIIGLRSIGTSLAAMVSAGAGGSSPPVSLRPIGDPFARRYAVDETLWQRLVRHGAGTALVDEGPGLSGSSFGALADRLEDAGVASSAIVVFPGHCGDLGPQAAPRHLARWARADRRFADADGLVRPRLASAVTDLTGAPIAPLEEVSAGRWRVHAFGDAMAWPPIHAMQERRKFLLRTEQGLYLLKFAGLGCFGRTVLSDARSMHAAGFGPEALGLRLGFLVLRWHEPPKEAGPVWADRADLVPHLAAYLAFRTRLPADDASSADLAGLARMTEHNIAEGLGDSVAAAWRQRYGDPEHLAAPRPVRTDNRMHAWEWFRTRTGAILKADGTDHCRAHDLLGCQDIAWDVAGAQVELDLTDAETEDLVDAVGVVASTPLDRSLLGWLIPAYLAFQLGSWTMAASQTEGAERARIERLLTRYRSKLLTLLTR